MFSVCQLERTIDMFWYFPNWPRRNHFDGTVAVVDWNKAHQTSPIAAKYKAKSDEKVKEITLRLKLRSKQLTMSLLRPHTLKQSHSSVMVLLNSWLMRIVFPCTSDESITMDLRLKPLSNILYWATKNASASSVLISRAYGKQK